MSMESNEEDKRIHVYTWKIENFSMCTKKRGEKLVSPTFKAKSFDDTAWCLELYPFGNTQSPLGYISCYLTRKEGDVLPFAIDCNYFIECLDKNGSSVKCNKTFKIFERGTNWGWHSFMKRKYWLKNLATHDTLTIRCTLSGNLPKKKFYSQNSCTTKCKIGNYSFQWHIKNFNSDTLQEVIKLPCSGSSQIEINIQIPEDDVKISLLIDKILSHSIFMSCNFALLDVEGKERDSKQATHLFETTETWEFPTFIKKSKLDAERNLYIKEDCFAVQCDITVSDGSIVKDTEEKEDPPLADKFTTSAVDTIAVLNEDIRRMYVDKIHTDIKLIAGKKVFPAHKNILCARSPVFLAMFGNDMAERQKGEVDIPDLDAKTVDMFLEYIYTGRMKDLDYENAMKLIVAADKYQVLSLKEKCAEFLASILSDANVCKILVTADLVQHDTLKTSVLDYIKKQPKKVFNSEEWKNCVKNNVLLATETASAVAILLGD